MMPLDMIVRLRSRAQMVLYAAKNRRYATIHEGENRWLAKTYVEELDQRTGFGGVWTWSSGVSQLDLQFLTM